MQGLESDIITPSKTLRTEVVQEVGKVAKAAYKALDLDGLAAVDLIVLDDLPVVVDVNTVRRMGGDSVLTKQITAGLSIVWQRNIARFYNTILERCIKYKANNNNNFSKYGGGGRNNKKPPTSKYK